MSSGFKYDVGTDTFLPDISELSLFCGTDKVGTCVIDLVEYIDKKPAVEKIVWYNPADMEKQSTMSYANRKLLMGEPNGPLFPGAYITFKIQVQNLNNMTTPTGSARGSMHGGRS